MDAGDVVSVPGKPPPKGCQQPPDRARSAGIRAASWRGRRPRFAHHAIAVVECFGQERDRRGGLRGLTQAFKSLRGSGPNLLIAVG